MICKLKTTKAVGVTLTGLTGLQVENLDFVVDDRGGHVVDGDRLVLQSQQDEVESLLQFSFGQRSVCLDDELSEDAVIPAKTIHIHVQHDKYLVEGMHSTHKKFSTSVTPNTRTRACRAVSIRTIRLI